MSKTALQIVQLLTDRREGLCTEEIAYQLGLTNRQVGGYMSALKRQGKVLTYTKGTITVNHLNDRSYRMGLGNSFYELIK